MPRILPVVFLSAVIGWASTGVFAAGSGGSSDSQETADKLDRAERLIEEGKARDAIGLLKDVVASDDDNADAYNYLGYAYRHLGEYEKSKQHYDRALAIDAEHRGAREYLGELFLKLGDVSSAQEQLARLDEICTWGCSEHDELEQAIRDYKQSQ